MSEQIETTNLPQGAACTCAECVPTDRKPRPIHNFLELEAAIMDGQPLTHEQHQAGLCLVMIRINHMNGFSFLEKANRKIQPQ